MDEGGQNTNQTNPLLPMVEPEPSLLSDPPIQPQAEAAIAAQSEPVTQELFDVICIGDIVTDDFIKLLDQEEKVEHEKDGETWLAIPFGTKIPFDHRELVEGVGNAGNAAVAFARLGLKTSFVTNVGGDQIGRDMIASLGKNSVDHRFVRINPDKKSNYHYVLWYKEERTILIKHEEYDYHWPHLRPNETPRWAYFSSISEHAIPYHDQVSDWLDANSSVKLAFQPGTFQMDAGTERLKRVYQRSEVLLLNREEAVTVGGGNHADINDLFNHLHGLGPKIVVITDGPAGAYASDGQNRFKMPLYPDIAPPFERTGAGDAFSSTFIAALAKGNTIEGALQLAPINSMSVVQKVGGQAGLLTDEKLHEYLRQAPEWYKPERF